VLANRLRGGETIGLRHLQIHHDQVELVRPCGLDGRNSVQRRLALAATLSQQTHRDGGIYFIVLGDQHPFPREYARSGSKLHGQVNRKSAAAAELAFQPDPAAHRGDDFLRDRESESQIPVFARARVVALHEPVENAVHFFRRDPGSGVDNLKPKPFAVQVRSKLNRTVSRKFYGVAGEVKQHLP